jgi:hypothetical protein
VCDSKPAQCGDRIGPGCVSQAFNHLLWGAMFGGPARSVNKRRDAVSLN